MNADTLLDASLWEAHAALRAGKVTPPELVEAALARLTADGNGRACLVRPTPEKALEKAGECRSIATPLSGLPVAHKDIFAVAGETVTFCTHPQLYRKGIRSADAVRALDDAGAINLGGLHLAEFAMGAAGWNETHGFLANPLDETRVSGGSSSGSAVSVARHFVFAALGTDTGGSIRIPASFCGVVGYKPSNGLVSLRGVFPVSPSLDTVGPVTRNVRDCALVLDVLTGRGAGDGFAAGLDSPFGAKPRFAVLSPESMPVPPEKEALAAMERVTGVLRKAGCAVTEVTTTLPADANALAGIVFLSEAGGVHMEHLTRGAERIGPQVRNRLLLGLTYPASVYVNALRMKEAMLARWKSDVPARADILLCPATPCLPPLQSAYESLTADEAIAANGGMGAYTAAWNYLGLPALAIPVREAGSLPMGVQLIGDRGRDGQVLRTGFWLEALLAI